MSAVVHLGGARASSPVSAAVRVWAPFVRAAFVFTLTAGTLTGALDLWTLRVSQAPVPVDHHRGHALAQLFGFLALFTLGVSLHLVPRFFGARPAARGTVRVLAWTGIGGAALAVVGRLGALVPGSAALGVVGAGLLVVAHGLWALEVRRWWRETTVLPEALHRFVAFGAGWWALAALTFFLWQLGQAFGGVLQAVPLEAVWSAALYGATGSWLWGLFFRAGFCTLGLPRAPQRWQRWALVAWQSAAVLAVATAWAGRGEALATSALGVATVTWFAVVRPWQAKWAPGVLPPRAVASGVVALACFGALEAWRAVGLGAPPLLADAARHVFTIGVALVLVLGFAGRMLPGFSGQPLRSARAYEVGTVAVVASAALRVAELSSSRAGFALAGASGGLAFIGVLLAAIALFPRAE